MNGAAGNGNASPLSWLSIVRLGFVQTALGAIVVLTTATLNRVMVVELQLPASLPGVLVALHYFVQLLRPRLGHGSDVGQRRTPWIIGGMVVLAVGGIGAAAATAWMSVNLIGGVALAVAAYVLIGAGVGAAGTSLLVLVAKSVAPDRRAPAASIMWMMMIAGFVITSALAGFFLDPFSPARLLAVSSIAVLIALSASIAAVWGVEAPSMIGGAKALKSRTPTGQGRSFAHAIKLVWGEERARRFTLFILMSMLAYSAQDLILEPYAGVVFSFSVGESTQLSSLQNGGVLIGMIVVAMAGRFVASAAVSLRMWAVTGCILSALSLVMVALSGGVGSADWLRASVLGLGFGNGVFAVAAIGSMMEQASTGHADYEGVRVGLWGAAQAVAFALGGLAGAAGVDALTGLFDSSLVAYTSVFVVDALIFLLSARMALVVCGAPRRVALDAPALPIMFSPRVNVP